jgi:AcrR family transcriptional regulator
MAIRVPRKPRDAYQHGDLRHALIQAGLKLLAEGGADALSLRAAAELAGVSHAAPYRHFKDKSALLAAIAEEGFRQLTARIRQEMASCAGGDLMLRLRAASVGYVLFAIENPASFRLVFGGTLEKGEVPPSLNQAGTEAYHTLRDLIVEGVSAGRLRAGDPDTLSLCAWSLVHGLANLVIDGMVEPGLAADEERVRAITTAVTDRLGQGLLAPKENEHGFDANRPPGAS